MSNFTINPEITAPVVNVVLESIEVSSTTNLYGMVHLNTVELQLRRALGKMITILDATVADGRQNKACKDLIRAALNESMTSINITGSDPHSIQPAARMQPIFD